LHSDIKVDRFQEKVPVDNEVVGLNVPVNDIELARIRDALDEASADLSDLPLDTCERNYFWENDPQRRWAEIMCSDFGWEVFIYLRIPSSFDSSRVFFEFLARVRPLIYDEDVRRHLQVER
jgi:hypothetical protein